MTLQGRKSALQKRAKRGFRGYPVATVAFYGPDDTTATKIAVGIVGGEDAEPSLLERWYSQGADVRTDPEVESQVLEFIRQHEVRSVVVTDGIIGCPHEEGIDYPEGTSCPKCPFWAGRDRWTKERLQ
jgi:hypothetical protein